MTILKEHFWTFVLILILGTLGYYYLKYKTKEHINTYARSKIVEDSDKDGGIESFSTSNVELPIEFDGEVLVRMYADEAYFEVAKPIMFKNPVIYHYGVERITRISGKQGELHLAKDTKGVAKEVDFANMKIWGNLRIVQKKRLFESKSLSKETEKP